MDILIWPGWLAGIGIGLVIVLHFWLMGNPLGCSSAYGDFCNRLLHPADRSFTKQTQTPQPKSASKLWFLAGIALGGFISAWLSLDSLNNMTLSFDLGMYETVLPDSTLGKAIWLIAGGVLLGLGSRLAGACTTGHAMVGSALLNPASLVAAAVFFVSALSTTQLLFNVTT